jgi:hydrogenase maturation protease
MKLPRGRVIGLGQTFAGDDAAGLLVIEHLRGWNAIAPVDLLTLAEASQLIEQLCDVEFVWIVDAVNAPDSVGCVLELSIAQLDARASCSASSHGLDVAQAIALCRELYPERIAPEIHVLGIGIDIGRLERTAPRLHAATLSPEVARATMEAAEHIAQALNPPSTPP